MAEAQSLEPSLKVTRQTEWAKAQVGCKAAQDLGSLHQQPLMQLAQREAPERGTEQVASRGQNRSERVRQWMESQQPGHRRNVRSRTSDPSSLTKLFPSAFPMVAKKQNVDGFSFFN